MTLNEIRKASARGYCTKLPQPKEEWCNCSNRMVTYGGSLTQEQIDGLPCFYCGKPLQSKPKRKVPEKLIFTCLTPSEGLSQARDKINQIIDYLND